MFDDKITSGKKVQDYSFEEFCEMIKHFATCMDDYLYFVDIQQDKYYISNKALERFAMSSNYFSNVTESHREFVYEEDFPLLQEDLNGVISGEKDEHNIEYRWISKDGEPVWINCRGRSIKDENGKPIYVVECILESKNDPDHTYGARFEPVLGKLIQML